MNETTADKRKSCNGFVMCDLAINYPEHFKMWSHLSLEKHPMKELRQISRVLFIKYT